MSLGQEIGIFFLGQSVIILGAIVVAYVRTQVAIAELQRDVKHVHNIADERKQDHRDLTEKVDGISRTVGKLEGRLKAS